MKIRMLLLMACLLIVPTVYAQHTHHHARNEIGISPGATYSLSHKTWGVGVHAHYFRTLSDHSRWSLGGGLETVFAHGTHWTVNVGAKYEIIEGLYLAAMPGISFFKSKHHHEFEENHEHNEKVKPSLHVELSYDLIHTEFFHIGPAIDFSWCKNDNHFMIGVHFGYDF